MSITAVPTEKVNLQKDSVCLSLQLGSLMTRRKVDSGSVTTDADPSLVHVSKTILESAELAAVNSMNGEIRRYLYVRCLPSPFRHGVYLLPVRLIEQVLTKLDSYKQTREELIESFLNVYVQQSEDARERLGSLFNANDYPAMERVKAAFTFSVQLWELGTPGALKAIDKDLYERELAKMNNVWESAKEQITGVLLDEFRNLTSHLAERLMPGADGKAKVLRDSVIGNMTEWLDLFSARNLTDDEQLKGLVDRARQLVCGLDIKDLRKADDVRLDIGTQFAALTTELDAAIIDRPTRKINLEEE